MEVPLQDVPVRPGLQVQQPVDLAGLVGVVCGAHEEHTAQRGALHLPLAAPGAAHELAALVVVGRGLDGHE